MADDSAQESPLYGLLTQLDAAPDVISPGRQRPGVFNWHNDVRAVVGPWVDDLLAAAKACGPMAKSPSPGQGIDSAWLRLLRAYLKGFEKVRQSEGLTEALNRYLDDLGLQAAEYRSVAYYAAKFRNTHKPGDLDDLEDDDESDLFAQLRAVANRYEKQWIDANLPPRDGTLTFHKVTPYTAAQDQLERAIYRFEEEAGALVLRLTDDCLIPDRLRRTPFFANAVFDALKGGGCYPGSLFRALCIEWLPGEMEGFGGENWLYPGCREDDAKRFNQGVRVARCAAALADALQGVVIEEGPKSEPPHADEPLTTVFLWGDVLPAKNLNVEAFYSPHAELARDIHSTADDLEREAEKGPTPTRCVESEDGLSASYPHREGDDPFPDTKEAIAKCRAAIEVCPESIRADLRATLHEASSFASTRSKATIAGMMDDIRRLAVRLRTIAHRVFDEGQAVSVEPAVPSGGVSHAESLRQLAAKVVAKRESDAAAESQQTETAHVSSMANASLLAEWFQLYGSLFFYSPPAESVTESLILLRNAGVLRFKAVAEELARRGERLGIDATVLFRLAGGLHSVDSMGRVLGVNAVLLDDVHALAKRIEARMTAPLEPAQPDPIVGFSAHALVAQGGGSLGPNDWSNPSPAPAPVANEYRALLTSLQRLKDRFSHGAKNRRPVIAVMVHSTSPKQRHQPRWPDRWVEDWALLKGHIQGLSSDMVPLRGREDFDAVANRPFLYEDGTPLVNGAGIPIPVLPAWNRRFRLFCAKTAEDADKDSANEFLSVASEAGRVIKGLSASVKAVLWQDWRATMTIPREEAGYWLTAVFELAWQGGPESGLERNRQVWLEDHSVSLESLEKYRTGELPDHGLAELADTAGDPPAYWYSQIKDIWQASEAAIDALVTLLLETRRTRPDKALSLTSEPVPGNATQIEPQPAGDPAALTGAVAAAWASWLLAEASHPPGLLDKAAYKWLAEQDGDKLNDYRLPPIKTWTRYIRTARNLLGKQKYQPRAMRSAGGSINKRSDV